MKYERRYDNDPRTPPVNEFNRDLPDDPTPKQRQGYYSALKQAQQARYYIQINCANSYIPDHKGKGAPYIRYAWPILFKTRGLAELAMKALPIFTNSEAIDGVRGRIKSASVEKTMIRL